VKEIKRKDRTEEGAETSWVRKEGKKYFDFVGGSIRNLAFLVSAGRAL
jgi:hypothetical protein